MVYQLVDIGLNLTHDSFAVDREAVLTRAQAAGVWRMIVTGSDLAHSRAAITLVQAHADRLRATAGVHPHHAQHLLPTDRTALLALIQQPEVVAVGECGLDYYRAFSPPAQQEQAFRLQLELATTTNKPVFLHQRDAHNAFCNILNDYLPHLNGGVAHCFTADKDTARTYLDMGLHIGITGWICDERRGTDVRDAVQYIPLDRLLIETDAPYLIPRDLTPKPKTHRNEPQYLVQVLQRIAACRSESIETIAAATTANALQLFAWH